MRYGIGKVITTHFAVLDFFFLVRYAQSIIDSCSILKHGTQARGRAGGAAKRENHPVEPGIRVSVRLSSDQSDIELDFVESLPVYKEGVFSSDTKPSKFPGPRTQSRMKLAENGVPSDVW
jgi:hypothetical protein